MTNLAEIDVASQIDVQARVKPLIEDDGLRFRDLNANGVLDPYEDWRLSPAERAADLVARMSPAEKIGLMVINSRSMGISQPDKSLTSHDGALDEQYHQVKNDPHNSAGPAVRGNEPADHRAAHAALHHARDAARIGDRDAG